METMEGGRGREFEESEGVVLGDESGGRIGRERIWGY